ncbi:unnamed protein product, partial [Didymodactylos carnosus]
MITTLPAKRRELFASDRLTKEEYEREANIVAILNLEDYMAQKTITEISYDLAINHSQTAMNISTRTSGENTADLNFGWEMRESTVILCSFRLLFLDHNNLTV